MSAGQAAAPAATPTPVVIIETNNFHEVLKHFDDDGQLLRNDASTRIAIGIPCSICMTKNLAVSCREVEAELTDGTLEPYAVLPCGHGFGYLCLYEWLVQSHRHNRHQDQSPYRPHCPMCRAPVPFFGGEGGSMRRVRLPPLFLGRDRSDDMRRIRAALALALALAADGESVENTPRILSGRDGLGTLPVAERGVLIENWAQLGTDEEIVAFFDACFPDATFELVGSRLWVYKKDGGGHPRWSPRRSLGSWRAEQDGRHHRRRERVGVPVSEIAAVARGGGQPVVDMRTEEEEPSEVQLQPVERR